MRRPGSEDPHRRERNFLHISSSWVNVILHTKYQLSSLPGSALKVPVSGDGGWVQFLDCFCIPPLKHI